jgi:lysophospholipase L1-like esterase
MKKFIVLFLLIITGCGVQAKEEIVCVPIIEDVDIIETVIEYVEIEKIITDIEYIEVPVEVVVVETVIEYVDVEVIKEVEVIKYKTKWRTEYIEIEKQELPKIIFVGDSITRGLGTPTFENYNVHNQGIGGFTTITTYNILQFAIEKEPEVIFIMLGVNDISSGLEIEQIEEYYYYIISLLDWKLPNTKIIIQSTLPVSEDRIYIDSELICSINEYLIHISTQYEQVEYLDLYSLYVNEDGYILDEYTIDGVHLSEQGYDIWIEVLNDYEFK